MRKPLNALRTFLKESKEEWEEVKEELIKHVEQQNREIAAFFSAEADSARERRIKKAIQKGMAQAKEKGVQIGGARNVHPRFSHRKIHQLARRGFRQGRIAERLGCSQSLVSRVLKEKKEKRHGHLLAR